MAKKTIFGSPLLALLLGIFINVFVKRFIFNVLTSNKTEKQLGMVRSFIAKVMTDRIIGLK